MQKKPHKDKKHNLLRMHDTALLAGSLFGKVYGKEGLKVLDVGGLNVNGSLRAPYESLLKMKYTCLDMEEHSSVDVVMKPGDPFPFEDETFDLVLSTSCFEHDPFFWMTFREMARIVKKGGYIYVNAPSNGYYHGYPGDNWRFYSDAGQALACWSGKIFDGKSYPVTVEETFHVLPLRDIWIDFATVWKRTEIPETNIVLDIEKKMRYGPLRSALKEAGARTQGIIYQE